MKKRLQKKLARFMISFFIIFFILTTIIELLDLSFLTNFITYISANYLGLDYVGNTVLIGATKFIVTNSCTGLVSSAILIALIFSGKKPILENKLFLAMFGVALILVLNIPRVMLVLITAKVGFDADLVHTITWFLMSGVVLVIWYYGNKTMGLKNFNDLL